ncbi:MAG: hypothetical protein JWR53_223 [Glaciihabitans sp.]|nr:hypothetical protein [Glaciihabitans sp.]
MTDPTAGPPAGWYADPEPNTGLLRWWSGSAWTEHTAPVPLAEPAPAPAAAPIPYNFAPENALRMRITDVERATYNPDGQVASRGLVPGSFIGDKFVGGGFSAKPPAIIEPFRPSGWSTQGVWIVAASPLLSVLLVLMSTAVHGGTTSSATSIGINTLPWVAVIFGAIYDRRSLWRAGYEKLTSPLWVVLLPLAWLIIRTVRVRRENGRGLAPLFGYLAATVISIPLIIAILVPTIIADESAAFSHQVQVSMQGQFDAQGLGLTVACPASIPQRRLGATFTCTATDAQGTVRDLLVTVTSNGYRASYSDSAPVPTIGS